jgi:hypothetical protein
MTTLADVRELVRIELGEASGGEAWSDDGLDRHIAHALEELSAAWPREIVETIATTPGSRDLSLAAIDGLIDVEAVEYPSGGYPPQYVAFTRWDTVLGLHVDTLPSGGDARLYVVARHVLDAEGTTLDHFQVELLVTGATAFAASERAASLANRLATGDAAAERFAGYGRARLTAFYQILHQYGRRNRVRARRLYVPA